MSLSPDEFRDMTEPPVDVLPELFEPVRVLGEPLQALELPFVLAGHELSEGLSQLL